MDLGLWLELMSGLWPQLKSRFCGLGGPFVVLGSTNKIELLSDPCTVAQHKQEQECETPAA